MTTNSSPASTDRYDWQWDHENMPADARGRLSSARVLVSRVGGVGGNAALQLAAAGVGGLVLAHGGNLRLNDLNRQILMAEADVGRARVESIEEGLRRFRRDIDLVLEPANLSIENASRLMKRVDLAISCAPLFEERFAMNAAAVARRVPLIDAAMHGMEVQIAVLHPGVGPCLRCMVSEAPPDWTRRFPVFGAVSAVAGALAATEAIKMITGLGDGRAGRLIRADLATQSWRTYRLRKDPNCPECSTPKAGRTHQDFHPIAPMANVS